MLNLLKQYYFQLLILGLSIFRPNMLFEKINQLNWYKTALKQWIDDQGIIVGSKVLEAGCATGALSVAMTQAGHIVTGVDYSRQMIEHAKSNHKNIEFLEANVLDLPFKSNEFDFVIATSLINIIDNKKLGISELTRCCKQGGEISILVPSTEFNDKDLRSLIDLHKASNFSAATMKAWHQHAPKMEPSDIILLFKQAKLSKIIIKKYLDGMVVSVSGIKPT